MDASSDEPPVLDRRTIEGKERARFVDRVLETTDLRRIDEYVRERGYERHEPVVVRERFPKVEVYTVTLRYRNGDETAVALWTGLDPDHLAAGDISSQRVVEELGLEDLAGDRSSDRGDPLPIAAGFLKDGEIGLHLTSDGIEETEPDWAALAAVAADVADASTPPSTSDRRAGDE